MQDLHHRAFDAYRTALEQTRVVTHADRSGPSAMPILYFGDLDGYCSSALKIVTVGLNPSQAEFPVEPTRRERDLTDDPWQRFPLARGCSAADPGYPAALNAYFDTKPLYWFDTFRTLLEGAGASFRSGVQPNTALHTDLCTPVPTTPTWSGLSDQDQRVLAQDGHGLWRDLVVRLGPDAILMSVARRHVVAAGLGDPISWSSELVITKTSSGSARASAYHMRVTRHDFGGSCTPLVVWGQAADIPFGTVSYPDRHRIGARALDLLRQESTATRMAS